MAGLRFTDLQSRPMEFLDFTSLGAVYVSRESL